MSLLHPRRESRDSASVQQRMRLFLTVAALVVALSVVKAFINWAGFEFLTLNPLFTSAIGGAIFIIGFLLANLFTDYKESERQPTELRVALEALHDDITGYARNGGTADLVRLRALLVNIVRSLIKGLSADAKPGELRQTIEHIDQLSLVIADLDKNGMQANFVTRLRVAQDSLRRSVFRMYHIQNTQFMPSIHILAYTLVTSVVFLLLFLRTEGSPASALMFGFLTYMFLYALLLIDVLEKPFRSGNDTLDDVSLFLLREFDAKVTAVADETKITA
jgi:hypothetical protein